jgi:AraC-like DNA-binding protein
MTSLTLIQGGPGWRRTWNRRLGEGRGRIVILNGVAREHYGGDREGAFSIKWMPKGSSVYRVEGASHRLSSDHAVILNARQPYELEFTSRAGSESLCVFFTDDLVARAWRDLNAPDELDAGEDDGDGALPEFPDLVFRPTEPVAKRLASLRDGYQHPDPSILPGEEEMLGLLVRLLTTARDHGRAASRLPAAKASTQRRLAARIERARELIEYSEEAPSLDALAEASALSKFHLLRSFKAAYGCTPSAYWRGRRLDRARTLLRGASMSVAEIGQALGYESVSAFIRAFRRHFGVNPSAVRA